MKNFKLLLATTAILSTGMVIIATADETYSGDPTGTVSLKAIADFTSPIRAEIVPINFGLLDPVVGGDVLVNPDDDYSYSGNAVLYMYPESPSRGRIIIYGGQVSYDIDSGFVDENTTGYVVFDDLANKNITLTETGSVGDGDVTNIGSGDVCGTVTNFTLGSYKIANHAYDTRTVSSLSIPIGATLSIDSKYVPSGNSARCEGSTTVTYMLYPD